MHHNFKNKAVRDLAWAISSVGLLNHSKAVDDHILVKEYEKFIPQLNKLDKNPRALIEFLDSKNTRRLGHYFEQLLFFWLEQSKRYTIIASNLPLRSEKKETLGEVDLIVYDTELKLHQHWELAVKFYLAHQRQGETTYIGPNANDYFHLKLDKLITRQCKILETVEGEKILNQLKIHEIETKLFVKGCLYYHPEQNYISKEFIHPEHSRSWWIYLNEAEAFLSDENQYALIHKNEWLSTPEHPHNLIRKAECLDLIHHQLSESPRSLQLACYKDNVLIDQGFVTRDTWPKLIV